MFRRAFLPLLAAVSLTACGGGQGPAAAADVLPLEPFRPNPASPPPAVLDVEAWGPGSVGALYVAAGQAGIDVHRVDGTHLQRLGRSPATRLAMLHRVAVDDREVTLLAAADAASGAVRWFAVDEGSGALQRLPEASTVIEGGVGGLCAQRDAVTGAAFLVATTGDGHLVRWAVTAHSGRVPGRPHRVETRLERRVPVAPALGDCAADPATGLLLALGRGGEFLEVTLPPEPGSPAVTGPLADAAALRLQDIASIEREGSEAAIVALDAGGTSLVLLSPSGNRLGRLELAQPASRVAASPALLAVTAADASSALLAPWTEVEQRLAAPGP